MSPAELAEVAFRMHEEGHVNRDALVKMLQQCVNIAAIENGYADKHGLPFPARKRRRSRRAP